MPSSYSVTAMAPVGSAIDTADRPSYERLLARLRHTLGDTAFDASWAEGGVMPVSDVVLWMAGRKLTGTLLGFMLAVVGAVHDAMHACVDALQQVHESLRTGVHDERAVVRVLSRDHGRQLGEGGQARLAVAAQRFGIEIHAYCVMSNHYHLLVETPEVGLSRGMKALNQGYAEAFNERLIGRMKQAAAGNVREYLQEDDE